MILMLVHSILENFYIPIATITQENDEEPFSLSWIHTVELNTEIKQNVLNNYCEPRVVRCELKQAIFVNNIVYHWRKVEYPIIL